MRSRLRAEAYQSQYGTDNLRSVQYSTASTGNAVEIINSGQTQYNTHEQTSIICSKFQISRDVTEKEVTL
jgi:hypothetical protein